MEKFCLKWNDFQANVSKTFSSLRKEQDFYDITLLKVMMGRQSLLTRLCCLHQVSFSKVSSGKQITLSL